MAKDSADTEGRPVPPLDFALGFPAGGAARIPAGRLRRAALLLLDTLGVQIAAHPMEAGRIARDAACRLYGAGDAGDRAPMLLDGRACSRAGTAFAAATQIDNLDAHDGYNPTKGHVGAAVAPALMAEAHGREIAGPDALAHLIAGYEMAGRAGIALHATVADYHTSGAWNALGVAVVGARIRGLSRGALRQALGIAEYHGPRSQMMREIANPTMLHDGSGMGALIGLSAVTLAEMGFTGAPAVTVEGPGAAPAWADLGAVWQLDLTYVKPYPICRWAHAAIDAVRALRADPGFEPGAVESISVRSFRNAVALYAGVPETTSQAQYSMAFAVAVMTLHGRIGLEHISGTGLTDPEVARMAARVTAVEDPRFEARYPVGRWAEVELRLRGGRVLRSGETHARGGPERPMPEVEMRAKFEELAGPVIGARRTREVWRAGLALTEPGSRLSDLASLLADPP